jgi:hypothetical protein
MLPIADILLMDNNPEDMVLKLGSENETHQILALSHNALSYFGEPHHLSMPCQEGNPQEVGVFCTALLEF